MIKAVVFDLDHTLFDRYGTLKFVAADFPQGFKIADGVTADFIARELIWADKNYVHLGWEHIHRHLIEKGIFAEAPAYADYRAFILSEFHKYAVPFPFTLPMLAKLKEMGLKTALITNGSHELQYTKLALLGMTDAFDSVIATRDIGVHKPERGPFDIMAARLGIASNEMLYVGDNPLNDVEGSRKAGYIPVWVRTTGVWAFPEIEKPELQVDTVEEIPALVAELNKKG